MKYTIDKLIFEEEKYLSRENNEEIKKYHKQISEYLKDYKKIINRKEFYHKQTPCLFFERICGEYKNGWNDAMLYIYDDGFGFQPFKGV